MSNTFTTDMFVRVGLTGLCFLIGFSLSAFAQITPSPPILLNSIGEAESAADSFPVVSTDGSGTWVTVWQSTLNLNDTAGTELDILFARSTDMGQTWSAPGLLNSNGTSDSGIDEFPVVAAGGPNVWVAVWVSNEDLNGTAETDTDIFFARSVDNGLTWSAPGLLNSNGTADGQEDEEPVLATDGAGNWVAVWRSQAETLSTGDFDRDLFVSRSADDGISWSAPAYVNSNGPTDNSADVAPSVATDGSGNWVSVWYSANSDGGSGIDEDIFVARSIDNGATWTARALLNTNATTDSGRDLNPEIASDQSGNWVTIWQTNEALKGTGFDSDIFVTRSVDNGATWSPPALLNTNGATDSGGDALPKIVGDDLGIFLSVWESTENLGGTAGTDADVMISRSLDGGVNWSAPLLLNTNGESDSRTDDDPNIAADGLGNWVTVWRSNENLNGETGTDLDIFVSTGAGNLVSASLSGRITGPTGNPASCAIIEASTVGQDPIVAVTALDGHYFFDRIPAAVYDLRILSSDFGAFDGETIDLTVGTRSNIDFQLSSASGGTIVQGSVIDAVTGEPLVAVLVEVLQGASVIATTYTCASGDYSVTLPGGNKGLDTVDVRFSLANYLTETQNNISIPLQNDVDEDLQKAVGFAASLSGVVTAADTEPAKIIAGARITLRGPANMSATTGGGGQYSFGAIGDGSYTVSASAVGFDSKAIVKGVGDGESAIQSFALELSEPTDVNGDGEINSIDIQLVINGVLGIPLPDGVDPDVNRDNAANSIDIQLVINSVLGV